MILKILNETFLRTTRYIYDFFQDLITFLLKASKLRKCDVAFQSLSPLLCLWLCNALCLFWFVHLILTSSIIWRWWELKITPVAETSFKLSPFYLVSVFFSFVYRHETVWHFFGWSSAFYRTKTTRFFVCSLQGLNPIGIIMAYGAFPLLRMLCYNACPKRNWPVKVKKKYIKNENGIARKWKLSRYPVSVQSFFR